jgi:predicted NAD/FAD-binding protein
LIYTPFGIAWRNFVVMIVIPLFSSVGTMPESEVWGTNVGIMLDYIHKTVGTDHYHPAPGFSARTIAERLAGSVTEQGEGKRKGYLRLGSQVKSVKYDDGEIVVELEGEDLKVDRVVLATPASVASTLLGMLEGSLADEGGEMELMRIRTIKAALKGVRYKVCPFLSLSLYLQTTEEAIRPGTKLRSRKR